MASLGWNTESTLLPKKAKKIAAPNTSMGALKDEVFAASMTAAAAGGKGKYARGTASRRMTDADDLDSAGRKRPRRREARRIDPEGRQEVLPGLHPGERRRSLVPRPVLRCVIDSLI